MLFNSLDFVFFFAVVYGLYVLLNHRGQNLLLLAAGYIFYGFWDWRFLSLLFLSTLADFILAQLIDASPSQRVRRRYLVISMCVSLGVLGFFKYFNFFAESLASLLRHTFGWSIEASHLNVILPWGISFYTFQTMNYTIDVYRRHMKPTKNLLEFSVFVSFFPHLIAGPIMRANSLLPQVQRPRLIDYPMIREGVWLILFGYFKKVVVADNMAPLVAAVFDHPAEAHGLSIVAAILAFAFQIYGDFSGYSDIARGISKLMGFDIMVNFRLPYFAVNPQDFWKRWHISLSTWLRDYLYIPLGGNRSGAILTYRNLFLTMLLGGLWHGAAWHFVAWGAYHGLLLAVHRLLQPVLALIRPATSTGRKLWWTVRVATFFVLTCFGWLLFRIKSFSDLPLLLHNVFSPFAWNGKLTFLTLACLLPPLLFLEAAQEKSGDLLVVKRWPVPARLAIYGLLSVYIVMMGWVEHIEFIYFQF